MTPTWEDLMNWGALGPDICGALPPAEVAGELIYCRMARHPSNVSHLDHVTGWTWRGERRSEVG